MRSVDDIEELHDVRMVHFFQEGYFTYCSGGHAFIFILEPDFLESYDLEESKGRTLTFPLVRSLAL